MRDEGETPPGAVAIVGMAGRFPGAPDIEAFWQRLRAGQICVRDFQDEELRAAGIPDSVLRNPSYVKSRGALDDVAGFDATLFGMSPREAAFTDPQHRMFLECAFAALEDAAWDTGRGAARVGVFGGVSTSSYFLRNVVGRMGYEAMHDSDKLDRLRHGTLGSSKDFLTTRVSYRLDLRGPSVDVQTACSSSLTAVHLAVQSLITHDCDFALAGGASVFVPNESGYLYQPGGVLSPDGRCRPFDSAAAGTIPGSGVGVVVFKRLQDALADGDPIRAVLLGSAMNNDGAIKVGFGAPGVDGQTAVIREALAMAGVSADTVTYVETHGTGTLIGDPIELAALRQAFGPERADAPPCALGALKANIGHLDAAAGVAGLIKAVLMLERGELVPQPAFERLNPKIDLGGRLSVNTELRPWISAPRGDTPRRAGVSSFGIGGTNVHVILEEAPARAALPVASAAAIPQVLVLSARTETALAARARDLADALEQREDLALPEVAHTLDVGRRKLAVRRSLVAADRAQAVEALRALALRAGHTGDAPDSGPVVLGFPGQGSQHVGLAHGLYQAHAGFRADIDRAAGHLSEIIGVDIRTLLFASGEAQDRARARLADTALAQPVLFAVEVALGRLWLALGVEPSGMIGHSVGELAAACLCGVFDFEAGLELVAARGALVQAQPQGAMLAARLGPAEARAHLQGMLALAAINAPDAVTFSGPRDEIAALLVRLDARGVPARLLETSHGFHSPLIEGAVRPFVERMSKIALRPPRRRFVSNVSGTWITDQEATDPRYWGRQLREPVRFADGLQTLMGDERAPIFLEVGPGGGLAGIVRRSQSRASAISSLARPDAAESDIDVWLAAAGQLWCTGAAIDWAAVPGRRQERRVALPVYPFEHQRYWIDPPSGSEAGAAAGVALDAAHGRIADPASRFWIPSWTQRPLVSAVDGATGAWLVIADAHGVGEKTARALAAGGADVVLAVPGESFRPIGQTDDRHGVHSFSFDATSAADIAAVAAIAPAEGDVLRVIYLATLAPPSRSEGPHWRASAISGLVQPCLLARALAEAAGDRAVDMLLVTSGLADVVGDERVDPTQALLLGAVRVIPQELPGIAVRCLDIDRPFDVDAPARILAEARGEDAAPVVALRGRHRWVERVEAVRLESPAAPAGRAARFEAGGVYVILGGLGRLGLAMAEWLGRERGAHVVLVGRRELPPRHEWPRRAAEEGPASVPARLLALTDAGRSVDVRMADTRDAGQLAAVLAAVERELGPVRGVIHAAHAGERTPVASADAAQLVRALSVKVESAFALEQVLGDRQLDFVVSFSSLAAYLGGLGTAAYCAANAFLDGFARSRSGRFRSIGWDVWQREESTGAGDDVAHLSSMAANALSVAEAMDAFERILSCEHVPHVLVSTTDLPARRELFARQLDAAREQRATEGPRVPRPVLDTEFAAPRNDIEAGVAEIFGELLGIERVGIHDSFFQLGGDSLVATMLMSKLAERFSLSLRIDRFLGAPTVAQAAAIIAQTLEAEASDAELETMLQEIESLSEDEVLRLLGPDSEGGEAR